MPAPACVAVIRGDALGDSLLSLPAVEALRAAWPEARLLVQASPLGAPVFEHVAHVVADLHDERPDVALVFTEKRKGFLAALRCGARQRVGFDPGLTQPLKAAWLKLALTHRVHFPNDLTRDPGLHEVERYFLLLEALGLPTPAHKPSIRLPLQPVHREKAASATKDENPVALQLMPRWTQDGWPESLARRTWELLPEPKIALYAPPDAALANGYEHTFSSPDLKEYAAVLERCRALITPDGGAVHVASSVGTPVVDLFPERHAAHCVRRWRPWAVEHRVVLRGEYLPESEKDLAERLVASALELCRSSSAS